MIMTAGGTEEVLSQVSAVYERAYCDVSALIKDLTPQQFDLEHMNDSAFAQLKEKIRVFYSAGSDAPGGHYLAILWPRELFARRHTVALSKFRQALDEIASRSYVIEKGLIRRVNVDEVERLG